jgi:hypothetical protein
MRTTRTIATAAATAIAVGVLISGSTVVQPDTYHDMKIPVGTQNTSATTSSGSVVSVLDTYHDM